MGTKSEKWVKQGQNVKQNEGRQGQRVKMSEMGIKSDKTSEMGQNLRKWDKMDKIVRFF